MYTFAAIITQRERWIERHPRYVASTNSPGLALEQQGRQSVYLSLDSSAPAVGSDEHRSVTSPPPHPLFLLAPPALSLARSSDSSVDRGFEAPPREPSGRRSVSFRQEIDTHLWLDVRRDQVHLRGRPPQTHERVVVRLQEVPSRGAPQTRIRPAEVAGSSFGGKQQALGKSSGLFRGRQA